VSFARTLCLALVAASPAAPTVAQVPVDWGVRFAFHASGAASSGIQLVDPSGATAPLAVAGLSPEALQASSGCLDPVLGKLYIGGGGTSAAQGQVRAIRMSGAEVSGETLLAALPYLADIVDLDLDANGNLFALAYDRVWRVRRNTGEVSLWAINPLPSFVAWGALAIDRETNRMWIAERSYFALGSNSAYVWILDQGPGPGTFAFDLTSCCVAPTAMAYDGSGHLYVGSSLQFWSAVWKVDVATGAGAPLAQPAYPPIGGLAFDRKHARLHLIEDVSGSAAVQRYLLLPEAGGAFSTVHAFPSSTDVPSSVAVNDLTNRTEVFPRRPSASAQERFEFAAHGLPGEYGFVALTAVNGAAVSPLVLGFGVCDAAGYSIGSLTLAADSLAAGTVLTLGSARLDVGTGLLSLGLPVEVVFGP
jgi:hypothetical protein